MSIPNYTGCKYVVAYVGRCGCAAIGDFCEKHDGVKCSSCGEQATEECSYTGQFVCGAPLCPKCEGYSEPGPSGAWGFLSHYHKRKDAPTRAEQAKRDEVERITLAAETAALGVTDDAA